MVEYEIDIPSILFTEAERLEIKELWQQHREKYKKINLKNCHFIGYRKSIIMIFELINLIVF